HRHGGRHDLDAGGLQFPAARPRQGRPSRRPVPTHRGAAALHGPAAGGRHPAGGFPLRSATGAGGAQGGRVMSVPFSVVLVLAFIAGVLALEGAYLLWNEHQGPDAQRLERRLRNRSAGTHGEEALKLLKRDASRESPWLGRIMLAIPRLSGTDRFLEQAGVMIPVSQFLLISVATAVGGFLLAQLLPAAPFWFALAMGVLGAITPYLVVAGMRRKRLGRIDEALPEAVDLISRALRAGHSFPAALEMVGSEMV